MWRPIREWVDNSFGRMMMYLLMQIPYQLNHLFFACIIGEIVYIFSYRFNYSPILDNEYIISLGVIVIGILPSIYGFINGNVLSVKKIQIKLNSNNDFSTTGNKNFRRKLNSSDVYLRLIQVSDIHIGTRSKRFLERVVKKINTINPDFVFITGIYFIFTFFDFSDIFFCGFRRFSRFKFINR
jgi:hypothetical protein